MKKAFDQTVRDIKRGVNKKVLKVPGIEQKILDATSNEPWGPHGSYLAEIAQATQNFHEYQLIMSVIWKRINDTGKNWRHVYKGLTVLEYLVAHGSERVIDEIKEHVYQISTLSDFQYIDSRGRDQGNNVRRKSQTLVSLVNDKERIQEVREKASANKDKYRNTYSVGGLNRSRYGGNYGDRYNDDRYDSHIRYQDDDHQHDYSRDRNGRDEDYDRSGRTRYSYSNDGDQYGQDVDRHGRENYKDDDLQFGSRSRSADSRRGHSFDDEDQFSSRSCLAGSEVPSPNDRQIDQKIRDLGAPPSYESATSGVEADNQDERKTSPTSTGSAPKAASPSPKAASHAETSTFSPTTNVLVPPNGSETDTFDEFDPRSSVVSDLAAEKSREMDLLGFLLVEDSLNSLALVPVTSEPIPSELDVSPNSGAPNSDAATPPTSVFGQPNEDLFGDAPFKALPGEGLSTQSQNAPSFAFSQANSALVNSSGLQPTETSKAESNSNTDFEESLYSIVTTSVVPSSQQPPVMPALATTSSVNVLDLAYTPSNILAAAQINAAIPPARSQTAPPEFVAQSLLLTSNATPANPFDLPNSMSRPGIQSQHATPNHFPQPSLSSSGQMSALVIPNVTPPKPKFEPKSAVWADSLSRGLLDLNISGPKTNADIGVDFESINRKDKFRMKEKNPAAPMSTITMGKAMGSGSGIGRSGPSSLGPPPNPTTAPAMGIRGAYARGMNQMMGMGIGGYAGGMNHPTSMGMNAGMAQSAGINHPMGMGMNAGMAQSAGINHPMGMGMNAGMAKSAGINHPMGLGMNDGMTKSADMNHPVGMQMNAGMAQSAGMCPGYGMPPNTGMPRAGYNPMMGMGGYGSQQPYGGGGYR